jgi:hypothetical protein
MTYANCIILVLNSAHLELATACIEFLGFADFNESLE